MDHFLNNLKQLEEGFIEDKEAVERLKSIDTAIRETRIIREQTPCQFYQVAFRILNFGFNIVSVNKSLGWQCLSLITNCLKNSAAANKTNKLIQDELNIIHLLVEYLDQNLSDEILNFNQMKLNIDSYDEDSDDTFDSIIYQQNKLNFYLNIMKYFFNFLQGNQSTYEQLSSTINKCLIKVLTLKTRLNNLNKDALNICCMILMFKSHVKVDEFKSLHEFLIIVSNVFNDQKEVDDEEFFNTIIEGDLLENGLNCLWSFKLIDFYFDDLFLDFVHGGRNYEDLDKFEQINLNKMLKFKLAKYSHELKLNQELKTEKKYFNITILNFYIRGYKTKTDQFISFIRLESVKYDLNDLNDSLYEINLIASCLSDMLTMQVDEHLNLLKHFQVNENADTLTNTLQLLKELHFDNLKLFDEMKKLKLKANNSLVNLKCNLIRLIGILVYENHVNQMILLDAKNDNLMILNKIIATQNLNDFDENNLFLREWSIVSLKHILSYNDFK